MHREVCWGNLLQNRQSEDSEVFGEYNITMDLTDIDFMNMNSTEQLYGVKRCAFELAELASSSNRERFLERRREDGR
jgi:hypothetical protein